jgi:hypothetical protein
MIAILIIVENINNVANNGDASGFYVTVVL